MPLFSLIFGSMLDDFNSPNMLDNITIHAYYYLGIGAGAFLCSWAAVSLNMVVGEKQAKRIREHYMTAVLRQDMAWFDEHRSGELTVRLATDLELILDGNATFSPAANSHTPPLHFFLRYQSRGYVRPQMCVLLFQVSRKR